MRRLRGVDRRQPQVGAARPPPLCPQIGTARSPPLSHHRRPATTNAVRRIFLERFTISLDDRLAEQFDAWLAARSYANRSEAVRDLLRAEIGRDQLLNAAAPHCVACLSYVFNHHQRDLAERLTSLQHEHHELTVSVMHAHLDHDHCLETVILRGRAAEVSRFADAVCAERGVHHGKLNLIGVELHQPHGDVSEARKKEGKDLAPAHVHFKPAA